MERERSRQADTNNRESCWCPVKRRDVGGKVVKLRGRRQVGEESVIVIKEGNEDILVLEGWRSAQKNSQCAGGLFVGMCLHRHSTSKITIKNRNCRFLL